MKYVRNEESRGRGQKFKAQDPTPLYEKAGEDEEEQKEHGPSMLWSGQE